MATRKSSKGHGRDYDHPTDITVLLRQIPMHVFFQMVNKSGMPSTDARDLCDAFRILKEQG